MPTLFDSCHSGKSLDHHWDPSLQFVQNTTFGGIQGFTRKPSTPWYNESGSFAGIVHQERGWKYVLVNGAGHLVPTDAPNAVRLHTGL